MTIAELFVNIGVKGDDKAKGALGGVKGTLGEISTAGLAAKAAILGAVYGLQRLMSQSAASGSSLMSYAAATGLSAENLQRWQYAARQANVGAEEMENSITGLQSAMVKMSMGQGAPQGMGVVANAVGIDPAKVRDTMYMMGKLNDYAKKEKNVDFANEMLKSFGLSMNMISAMRRNAFDPKNLAAAPIYSNAEASQLQKVDVAWGNLGKKIEMAIGHLNAKHGLKLISDIASLTTQILKLADALIIVSEKLKVFEVIGETIGGITKILRLANGESLDKVAKDDSFAKSHGGRSFGQGTWWMNMIEGEQKQFLDRGQKYGDAISPNVRPIGSANKPPEQKIVTTVHNHGVKDAKEGSHHVKKAVQDAARQIGSQSRAN